jgi:hypothetical protein
MEFFDKNVFDDFLLFLFEASPQSVFNLAQVSKQLNHRVNQSTIWEKLCKRYFPKESRHLIQGTDNSIFKRALKNFWVCEGTLKSFLMLSFSLVQENCPWNIRTQPLNHFRFCIFR